MNRKSDEQFYREMSTQFGNHALESMPTQLPALLITHFPGMAAQFTADFIVRYAIAIFTLVTVTPTHLLLMLGMVAEISTLLGEPENLFTVALKALREHPERCEPSYLLNKMKDGFEQQAPTIANALTEQVVIDMAKLCLLDWLEVGDNLDYTQIENDTHFYMDMAMDIHNVKPSMEALDADVEQFLNRDDHGDVPEAIVEQLRQARAEWRRNQG